MRWKLTTTSALMSIFVVGALLNFHEELRAEAGSTPLKSNTFYFTLVYARADMLISSSEPNREAWEHSLAKDRQRAEKRAMRRLALAFRMMSNSQPLYILSGGVTASEETPDYIKSDQNLRRKVLHTSVTAVVLANTRSNEDEPSQRLVKMKIEIKDNEAAILAEQELPVANLLIQRADSGELEVRLGHDLTSDLNAQLKKLNVDMGTLHLSLSLWDSNEQRSELEITEKQSALLMGWPTSATHTPSCMRWLIKNTP